MGGPPERDWEYADIAWSGDPADDDNDGELGKLDEWESWDWSDINLPPGPEYTLYKRDLEQGN